MICPHCHKDGSTVASELAMGTVVFRQRTGACGHAWTTWESHLISDIKLHQIASNTHQTTSKPHQTASKREGGGGVGDSGSGSLSGSSGSDPDPSKLSDQLNLVSARESNATQQEQTETTPKKPRKPRSASKHYPVEFEAVWEGTGKHGVKLAAMRAWEKAGKPLWDGISSTWSAYLLSDGPNRGAIHHLSTWLNQDCHRQEWFPAQPRNGIALTIAAREAAYDKAFAK